ncbi:trypsin-like peptidase domain-containing protein [Breoghania sp. L-A4]|uniref:trypsin-like serine peptidase n=1 Tax=Breoghania sp. L-A4 TaxID=2304600 RepID=UPI0013C326B3|nr:trypsin-like peptidase domain-containing protein [Breoghania sp. L-A4]
MARKKTPGSTSKRLPEMVEIDLGGLERGEAFPEGYFGPAPAGIFGPRSLRDPLELYAPCYMDDMFGAGMIEPSHRAARAAVTGSLLPPPLPRPKPAAMPDDAASQADGEGGPPTDTKQKIIFDPKDDRVPVDNTLSPPHRCICRLRTVMTTGAVAFGTGWFASPNIVVTAGHCLFPKEGHTPLEIYVTPGLNRSQEPFQSQRSKVVRVPTQWTKAKDDRFDYGVIVLPDKHMGSQTGWFGYASTKDSHLDNMRINSLGYPQDGGYVIQVSCPGRIRAFADDYLWHSVDTKEGQSGSPIFHTSTDGKRTVIGIHTDADGSLNRAVRITPQIFKEILDAINDNA